MVRSSSVDPAKVKTVIKFLVKRLAMKVLQAMRLIKFSNKVVDNLSLRCFIQQSLPGKTVKGMKAHVSRLLPPPPMQPDQAERLCNRTIDVIGVCTQEGPSFAGLGTCEHVMALTPSPFPPWSPPVALPQERPSLGAASTSASKQKSTNHAHYARKKPHVLDFDSSAVSSDTITPSIANSTAPPPDSPFLPALPQQLIHGWAMPMAWCACQLREGC